MKRIAALLFVFSAQTLSAQTCPDLPDSSAETAKVLRDIQAAPNEMVGRQFSDQMWQIWTAAPDALAQEMLDLGMRKLRESDFLAANEAFDRLIDYCPDYAEGYNQRAFAAFLSQEFEAALRDLDRAIALSPEHFGALAGRALTLIGLGRDPEAQEQLRAAVALNPWLSERALLDKPQGRDI